MKERKGKEQEAAAAVDFGALVLHRTNEGSLVAEDEPRAAKKARAAAVYETTVSGVDFVVRRTTAKTSRIWVMLVSQGQYYIKDEHTGEVSELSPGALTRFLKDLGEAEIRIGCPWLPVFWNTEGNRRELVRVTRDRSFREVVRSGVVVLDSNCVARLFGERALPCSRDAFLGMLRESPAFMRYLSDVVADADNEVKLNLAACIEGLFLVLRRYGLDRAREFVRAYLEYLATKRSLGFDLDSYDLNDLGTLLGLRRDIRPESLGRDGSYRRFPGPREEDEGVLVAFEFDRLCDYLFQQSLQEGTFILSHWLRLWIDTLAMQVALTGAVTDKYPDNLFTAHNVMSMEFLITKKEWDRALWEDAEKTMARYDYSPNGSRFIITHPSTPEDMRSEAAAQSHCLASYIGKVIEGKSLIFFCRRASAPEKSLVTIEVSPERMSLSQVKTRFNKDAPADAMEFISKWCREIGIGMGRYEASLAA